MSLVSNPSLGCSAIPHTFAIVRFLRKSNWKSQFVEIASRFEAHKADLDSDLRMYITINVKHINSAVTHIGPMMEAVFAEILSPEEKELSEFADKHGGIKGLLNNSWPKEQLFSKLEGNKKDPSGMSMTIGEFTKELEKDVTTILDENKDAFEERFRGIESLLDAPARTKQESDRVIKEVSAIHAGPHDQVIDKVRRIACSWGSVCTNSSSIQDLHFIWEGMVRTLSILIGVY